MKRLWFLLALLIVAVSLGWSDEEFFIHDGDRVVIWGDSITDDAFYPRSIENFTLCRFPDWTVEFHNLGWGGDRTVTLERMKRDLPPYKPTAVTIKLGMNDGSYMEYTQENFDRYIDGYRQLLDFLRETTDARIALITTVTYETDVVPVRKRRDQETDMSVYPDTLRRFSRGVEELSKEYGTAFIDLNDLYAQALKRGKKDNPDFKLSGDAIHPNVNGQAYMAYYILKGMNAPGSISEIVLDAQAKQIVKEKGSYVRSLTVEENRLSFSRHDRCLPFLFSYEQEFDERMTKRDEWYNDLNKDFLTIRNLPWSHAALSIDGQPIAIFSSEEWAKGINLSLLPDSPMLQHAALIADLTGKRHEAEYARWRKYLLKGVRSPYDFTPCLPDTTPSLYLKDAACFYHQAQLQFNDPVPHQFVLTGGEKDALDRLFKK